LAIDQDSIFLYKGERVRSTNGRTLKSEMSKCLLLSSGDSISHLPGVNRLNMELKNEENSLIRNVYSLNIVGRLPLDGNDQIRLHAGSDTTKSSQPATNYVPANVVDGAPAPQWFADSADIPDWERRLYPWRLPRDHFMPGDTATWADVVTVLLRMLNLKELKRL
jgi:hypothetical protein